MKALCVRKTFFFAKSHLFQKKGLLLQTTEKRGYKLYNFLKIYLNYYNQNAIPNKCSLYLIIYKHVKIKEYEEHILLRITKTTK